MKLTPRPEPDSAQLLRSASTDAAYQVLNRLFALVRAAQRTKIQNLETRIEELQRGVKNRGNEARALEGVRDQMQRTWDEVVRVERLRGRVQGSDATHLGRGYTKLSSSPDPC